MSVQFDGALGRVKSRCYLDSALNDALRQRDLDPSVDNAQMGSSEDGEPVSPNRFPDLATIVRQITAASNIDTALALLASSVHAACGALAVEIRDRDWAVRSSFGSWPQHAEPTDTTVNIPLRRGTSTAGYVRILTDGAQPEPSISPVLATLIDLTALAMEPVSPSKAEPAGTCPTPDSVQHGPSQLESTVLGFVSELICSLSGADFAYTSCRLSDDPQALYGAYGMRSAEWRGLLTRERGSLTDRALRSLQPVIVESAEMDAFALPGEVGMRFLEGAQSLLCVPAGVIGVELIVTGGWRRKVRLDGHRLEAARQIVDRFTCLLRGAQARNTLDQLAASVEVVGATMELDAQCTALLQHAAHALGVDHCAIHLADDRSGGLTPLAWHGLPQAFFRGFTTVKPGSCADTSSSAVALGRTVVTPDLAQDEGWAPYLGLATPLGLRAAWSTPLVGYGYGMAAVGALTAYRSQIGVPTDEQAALLEMYAALLARAYDQSRQPRRADPAALKGSQLVGILGQLPCGVIVLNERQHVVFRNDVALTLCHDLGFALRQDDWIRASIFLPDTNRGVSRLEQWQAPVSRALRGETVPACEMRIDTGGGEHAEKCVVVAAAPLRDETDRVVGAALMLADCRKERSLIEDLATAEAQLRAIQEAVPYGVALFDAQGTQVWATDAAEKLGQYRLEGAPGTRDGVLSAWADERADPLRIADLPIAESLSAARPVHHRVVLSRGPDGEGRWIQLDAAIVQAETKSASRYVVCAQDITEHKQAEMALAHQAMHDALTGLPNRIWFHLRLGEATSQIDELGSIALLVLDIDRFREVNDTLGHVNGDILVQLFAKRLVDAVGPNGFVGRLGGDEFGVLIERATVVDATSMARKILHHLEQPFEIAGQTLDVDASVGVALCPDHGNDSNALFRRADIAMYVAKHSHDGFAVYTAKLDLHSPDRLSLLGELRRAIEQNHLFLAYQPLIRISDQKLVGMEALVRWQHPVHGLIYPDGFINLAEGTGAIKPLTAWVLNEALRQCSEWRSNGYDLRVSVNLSARNLHDVSLASSVLDSLLKYHVPPNLLTLEITESAIMSDPSSAMIVLSRLSNMGVHLAIDDFGTGYSSLAYLQRLPTRNIKIDKSFVLRLAENANDAAIVKAIIELGHSLGHSVLAEGVEQESALELLSQLGCDFAQGYYFSKPLPAKEIEDWMRERA